MKTHAIVAAYFALCCGAMSLGLALSEVILLRSLDQGLPAAGLLAAGGSAYAAGQFFAKRVGQLPSGPALMGQFAAMALVFLALSQMQPLVVDLLFAGAAPKSPLQQLPGNIQLGLTMATLCITLATFRAGARQWLEQDADGKAGGAQPA